MRKVKNRGTQLVSPPGRLRAGASAGAARISAALLKPLLSAESELTVKLRRRIFPVNEIAEAPSYTPFTAIESTTGFSEIRDG